MTSSRSLEIPAACIVVFQVVVMAAVWLLDPTLLSNQRNIGILMGSSIMQYGALCHLYLINIGVLGRNLQWTAAAVGASFAMLIFIIFPFI